MVHSHRGMNQGDDRKPAGPYDILKNRDFLLYLIGRFIASFGQQMVTVAVGWQLYERTHEPISLGFVGLTQMVPMIGLTLPAGHFADNHDRKRTIMCGMLVMSLASVGLALSSWFEAAVGWIYACLFLGGCARTFLWPASSAFMPQLVSKADFPRAVTWNTGSFHLSSVIGPAVGGAVIALTHSATPVYIFEGIALSTCAFLVFLLHATHTPLKKEPMTIRSLIVGFEFVFATKIILATITLDLFAVLLGGATSLLPVYAKDILHVGPQGLGILQAGLPVGSFICSAYLAHRAPFEKAGRTLLWAVAGFGLATIVFGLSRNFALSVAMLVACGITDNVSVVVRHTLVQLLTPDEKRGRVSAVNSLFIGTSNELGGFESGIVAQYFGPIFSVVAGGIGTILVALLVGLKWPDLKRYGRLGSS
jgi:MFS family permease